MKRTTILSMILMIFIFGTIASANQLIERTQDDDDNEADTSATPYTQDSSRYDVLLSMGNVDRGETLFNTFQADAGFACATCHNHASEDPLIGPGLLNVATRAETRIEDQGAAHYLFTSIVNPDDHIVEGFTADLMPENWAEIYTVRDIADIMSYLFTLNGETVTESTENNAETGDNLASILADLPAGSDPSVGEELFNTFQPAASFACSTCHNHESEDTLIGPGLLNVVNRAGTRIEGQSALDYLLASIITPDDFVVDGFSADLMPENWAEIYSEDEIYHIIAYLITLEEG